MSMINIAIIGCGAPRKGMESFSIGHAHAAAWQSLDRQDIQLHAVDISQENLNAFAQKFGLPAERCHRSTESLYAAITPDVASICTWPGLHHSQVIQAANAGVRGIVCEKPVALDGQQMDEMIACCEKHQSHLVIAHQRRYEAQYERARDIIRQGKLGGRLILEARVAGGWDVLSWTVHWFDMASYLLDDQPARILAGMDVNNLRRYGHAVENSSVVFIEYSRGHQGLFVTGPDAPLGEGISIRGSQGELRLNHKQLTLLSLDGIEIIPLEPQPLGNYAKMLGDLLDVLEGRLSATRCSIPDGALGTRLALAAQESARTRSAIGLANFHTGFAPLEILQHESKPRPLVRKAILLADPHHRNPATGLSGREGLMHALQDGVAEHVHVVPANERGLTQEDLADADLLVVYHTQQTATLDQQQLLAAYVNAGRPMLVVHCGIGAYASWPQYQRWLGRYWVWQSQASQTLPASEHPHLPCQLQAVEGAADIHLSWADAWLPRDEVYIKLGQAGPIQTLAAMLAHHPDGSPIHEPAIWRPVDYPNILVTLPGHRYDIWTLPAMRDQLRASAAALLRATMARQK